MSQVIVHEERWNALRDRARSKRTYLVRRWKGGTGDRRTIFESKIGNHIDDQKRRKTQS